MSIAVISSTNRPDNLSLAVAGAYSAAFVAQGAPAQVWDLCALPRDMAFADLYGSRSPEFQPFQDMVLNTTDFVFVVPEYNGSIPGILKLFIDACDYPESFEGKRAALAGLSAGATGNAMGLSHLRDILEFLGTRVLEEEVQIGRVRRKIGRQGELADAGVEGEIARQVAAFLAFRSALP